MILKYAAIIIKDKRILLVRKKGTLAFISPGGKPEPKENAEECLQREIKEELMVSITNAEKYRTDYSISTFEQQPIKIISYLTQIDSDPTASSEIDELHWTKYSEIHSMIIGSVFRDKVIPALKEQGLLE